MTCDRKYPSAVFWATCVARVGGVSVELRAGDVVRTCCRIRPPGSRKGLMMFLPFRWNTWRHLRPRLKNLLNWYVRMRAPNVHVEFSASVIPQMTPPTSSAPPAAFRGAGRAGKASKSLTTDFRSHLTGTAILVSYRAWMPSPCQLSRDGRKQPPRTSSRPGRYGLSNDLSGRIARGSPGVAHGFEAGLSSNSL